MPRSWPRGRRAASRATTTVTISRFIIDPLLADQTAFLREYLHVEDT